MRKVELEIQEVKKTTLPEKKKNKQFVLSKDESGVFRIGFPSKKRPGKNNILIIQGCDMTKEDEAKQALEKISQVTEATTDVWDGQLIIFEVHGVYSRRDKDE